MNTKQKIGPAAIVGAVLVVALVVFFIYRSTLGAKNEPPPEAAAEHRDMAEFYRNQGHVGSGTKPATAPTGQ